LSIYDLQGRLIYSSQPVHKNNEICYTWDTSGRNGKNAAAKIYILLITNNGKKITQRLLLN
jgi:hypothetical protein